MDQVLSQIREDALQNLNTAKDLATIEEISIRYLGRKGIITQYLRNIPQLPMEERPEAGKRANQLKDELAKEIELKKLSFSEAFESEQVDVTLPGRPAPLGSSHPITQVSREIWSIFTRMGFGIAEGPEIELDYYNFEALNFPKEHPARDMQDTFFISPNIVLRTHTSPIQIRVMEKEAPPIYIIAHGRVFRCDSDITHTPMFHQIEGLVVDQNISFSDLKGILTEFIHQLFDKDIKLRFRPSFFPFTEPSAEIDILCIACRGKGCRICSQSGWLEVLGAGMVHPALFAAVGYESNKYTGFAFGMGVERLTMLKYGVDDLRKFFDNNLRFLKQF